MKVSNIVLTIGGALALIACQSRVPSAVMPASDVATERQHSAELNQEHKYFEGQVMIQVKPDTDLNALVMDFSKQGIILSALKAEGGGRPIYLFEIESSKSLDDSIAALKADSRIVRAGKNYEVKINRALTYNDPDVSMQWSMENFGQDAPASLAGKMAADIHIAGVDTAGSMDSVVAIVDTGVDYLHEDISVLDSKGVPIPAESNLWINPEETPDDGVNNDNNGGTDVRFIDDVYGYDFYGSSGNPMDDHGHGTHIAGVIGGLRNNFKGIVGMNGRVAMMGAKFLSARGGGDLWDAVNAVNYVTDMSKRFPNKKFTMNHSWGSSARDSKTNTDEDDFLFAAFKESDEADIVNCVAAGNESTSLNFGEAYPAKYSAALRGMITVAASNNLDQIASFSNYGSKYVQVAAPGVLIHSSLIGNKYAAWSGTSMATPHVTGLSALLRAKHPSWTNAQVRARIEETVDKSSGLQGYVSSGGRINVARALSDEQIVRAQVIDTIETVPHKYTSPNFGFRIDLDYVQTFKQDGAKEIAVCFEKTALQDGIDWIQIYGNDYRVRDQFTGLYVNKHLATGKPIERCTAFVPGDTVHVRLFTGGFGFRYGPGKGYTVDSLKVVR